MIVYMFVSERQGEKMKARILCVREDVDHVERRWGYQEQG